MHPGKQIFSGIRYFQESDRDKFVCYFAAGTGRWLRDKAVVGVQHNGMHLTCMPMYTL